MTKNKIIIRHYHSCAGELKLGSYDGKLCLCDWALEKRRGRIDRRIMKILDAEMTEGSSSVIEKSIMELDAYFSRQRTSFDIPLLFAGTDFQKLVWNRLLDVPYGQTMSYGEMARQLGCPNAVRAVANANGANAISIFAPCHRIIGSNHQLVGYGGGLKAKKYLLELEGGLHHLFRFENDDEDNSDKQSKGGEDGPHCLPIARRE